MNPVDGLVTSLPVNLNSHALVSVWSPDDGIVGDLNSHQ